MDTAAKNPTQRFSSRVENYIKFRPSYPATILDLLRREANLTENSIITDVGSGTGILTELFLKNGNTVFAVEPNREMREAAERLLRGYPSFHSVSGAAEATTLEPRSADIIVAGQTFHWFNREKTRREFVRILKPGGTVALIWNDRNTTARPFLSAYEEFLKTWGTDYEAVNHKQIDGSVISSFFGANGFRRATFPNEQVFDFDGLKGRLLSSSYAPEPGHPKFEPMMKTLREIFDQHQTNSRVTFEYDTAVYYGCLS
jgi:SAM-dependent methyltransferase